MYSQKSFPQKLGKCKVSIKSQGCYLVSFCNLLNELKISKINPLELNEYLIIKDGYSNGCLFNSSKIAKLFNLTYEKIFKDPGTICIIETDFWKPKGVPQHFVLFRQGMIADPLDLNPKWKLNVYPIVSYRVFKPLHAHKIPEPIDVPPEPEKPVAPPPDAPQSVPSDTVQIHEAEKPTSTVELEFIDILIDLLQILWNKCARFFNAKK